ncbi:hypothetical protein Hanom_Chr03g00217661 [Helianthus anomalus]
MKKTESGASGLTLTVGRSLVGVLFCWNRRFSRIAIIEFNEVDRSPGSLGCQICYLLSPETSPSSSGVTFL